MICKAYLVANSIEIKALPSELKLREACFITLSNNIYVIFPYGVVVCWGDGQLGEVLVVISSYLKSPYPADKMLTDEFEVKVGKNETGKLVFDDCFYLDVIDKYEIAALSHPIAQSIRLILFEDTILESINKVKHIPKNLAEFGKIKDTKKNIYKMQGHLHSLKVKMSFEHPILDKPEFFWEFPEYDDLYGKVARYLEVEPRINILEKKIGTIDDILSLLSDELNHRHSSQLEWIIILLILIEIIIFFLQDIFKLI